MPGASPPSICVVHHGPRVDAFNRPSPRDCSRLRIARRNALALPRPPFRLRRSRPGPKGNAPYRPRYVTEGRSHRVDCSRPRAGAPLPDATLGSRGAGLRLARGGVVYRLGGRLAFAGLAPSRKNIETSGVPASSGSRVQSSTTSAPLASCADEKAPRAVVSANSRRHGRDRGADRRARAPTAATAAPSTPARASARAGRRRSARRRGAGARGRRGCALRP